MEKVKMSIHQGLSELKLLDSRIKKADSEARFVEVNKITNKQINGMDLETFSNKVLVASFNSEMDLINRRNAIKAEIVKSNAITLVEIGSSIMTVAEAIERKSSIGYEKAMLNNMKNQYNSAHVRVNKHNENIELEADKYVQAFYQDKENAPIEDIDKMKKTYVESKKVEVLDPLNLREKIEKLEKSIEEFELNADYKLSESNALTFIEI